MLSSRLKLINKFSLNLFEENISRTSLWFQSTWLWNPFQDYVFLVSLSPDTGGYCIYMGCNLILWSPKKEKYCISF